MRAIGKHSSKSVLLRRKSCTVAVRPPPPSSSVDGREGRLPRRVGRGARSSTPFGVGLSPECWRSVTPTDCPLPSGAGRTEPLLPSATYPTRPGSNRLTPSPTADGALGRTPPSAGRTPVSRIEPHPPHIAGYALAPSGTSGTPLTAGADPSQIGHHLGKGRKTWEGTGCTPTWLIRSSR